MTQEDKELLLEDLCARLPYGVKCSTPIGDIFTLHMLNPYEQTPFGKGIAFDFGKTYEIEYVKPYLRPMSSMTDEEWKEYRDIVCCLIEKCEGWNEVDWLNAHHFDYRGLIEKGLALEAPKGMYC